MAKFGIKCYLEFDTDPDGENKSKSLLSPESLMVILPYVSKMVRDIGKTKSSDGPTGDTTADVLRDLEQQAARTVARESQENG